MSQRPIPQNAQYKNPGAQGQTQSQLNDEESFEEEWEEEYEEEGENSQVDPSRRSKGSKRGTMRSNKGFANPANQPVNRPNYEQQNKNTFQGTLEFNQTIQTQKPLQQPQKQASLPHQQPPGNKQDSLQNHKVPSVQSHKVQGVSQETLPQLNKSILSHPKQNTRRLSQQSKGGAKSQVSGKGQEEAEGESYYDEEYDEYTQDGSKMGMSRASDAMMRTPHKSFMSTKANLNQPNVMNDKLTKATNQEIYNKIFQRQPVNNDDYFTTIRRRKEGVPVQTKVPRVIEAYDPTQQQMPLDPLLQSQVSLTKYKEIIPSFLPNEDKYKKFQKVLQDDEQDDYKRLNRNQINTVDAYDVSRKAIKHKMAQINGMPYHDPFDQHQKRIEDRLKGQNYSPGDSFYDKREQNMGGDRRGPGFHSVQRTRDPIKMQDDGKGNISLPYIKEQIDGMERNMEKELDREAKLKKDARRLIVHSLGKNVPEMERTVKAWLKKEHNGGAFINQGPIYSKEYRQLIYKEMQEGNFKMMNQFIKNGVFDNGQVPPQNALQKMKDKMADQKMELAIVKQNPLKFHYERIRDVYNVSLLDQHFGSPEAYLLKKKQDAKITIAHVFKRKFEEKLIFQQLSDPRTLRKDKTKLEEKLRMISVAVELAKQRLEWLVYDTPFSIPELEDEVKRQKEGISHVDKEEQEQLKKMANNFKFNKELFSDMQKKARDARNLLDIKILEVRALKNRTGCESISDFVLLFREFIHIEKINDLQVLFQDALLNKKKSQDFYEFIKKIVDFEDEMLKVRNDITNDRLEELKADHDQFYNYDELVLEKVKLEDKDEMAKIFKQSKVIFQFIPFWYMPINKEGDPNSQLLRSMLKFDIMQSKIICQFLTCQNLDEIITYQRHNRKIKEFSVFDKEEIGFLCREHRIPEAVLKDFGQLIAIISREYLMVPQLLFSLARPTKIQEVNFSEFKGEHLSTDAISAIVTCLSMHQANIKRLIFENCEMDMEGAQLFKLILSDDKKPILSCSFEHNKLGDPGLDHIVQAIKNNPKGDMRILKISNNKLSIQAAIRISHVLKKRPQELPPLNLQILKMRNNQIGNIGTETLANFIKRNMTLKYLDIAFNQIGDRGLLSVTECLRENEKLEVLLMLGNEFTEKALAGLGAAFTDNKKMNLIIFKLGHITCESSFFQSFINSGYMVAQKLKYLYLTTNQFKDPMLQTLNDNFLPKLFHCTEGYDPHIDSSMLLDFMTQVVEYQLFEGGNTQRVYKYGDKLLREIIKEKYQLNNVEILIYLFDNIFGPEFILKDNLSPFHLFAKHGQIESISYCLKLGVSPNFKTSIGYVDYPSATALHIAAGYSQIEMCSYLLKFGVEIDNKDLNGNTALHYAAVQGAIQLAQLLVDNGANLIHTNKKNMLPLHSCVFSDNLPCFKFVLEQTEKQRIRSMIGKQYENTKDIKTYQGFTPIMIALEEQADSIFQYLLENGADLKAQDEEGNTVLHRAILIKEPKKARMLIKQNHNIFVRSFAGETPIMMAVRSGLLDVVRALFNKGADLMEKNYRADTLLHLAARTDHADLVGYLLDKGLSTLDKNREGQKPADLAVRQGIKLLLTQDPKKPYPDASRIAPNRQRLQAPSEADEDDLETRDVDKRKQAYLLNEEMVKYRIDQRETMGSQYKEKYGQFKGTQLSRVTQEADKDELKDEGTMGEDLDEDAEEYDEGEEYEDDEEMTQGTRSVMNKTQTKRQEQARNNAQHQRTAHQQTAKAKQSAGFRGTADIKENNATAQHLRAVGQRSTVQQSAMAPKTNTQYPHGTRGAGDEEGEEEYMDEDGEEFDEEDMDHSRSHMGRTAKSRAPGQSQQTAVNQRR